MRVKYFVLLFISSAVWGSETLTKADFAYGIDVNLEAHQLYEFTVNEPIYRYLHHDDLRDLRIFDERGVMVPIKIIIPSQAQRSEVVHSQTQQALAYFPVSEDRQQPVQDLNVYVQRNNDGTIVNINSSPITESQQHNTYYIVDLGEKPRTDIHALEIAWNGDEVPKAIVNVQTSEDLTRWQLSGEGAVFQLRHNEQFLSRNHVTVSELKRYLKIRLDQAVLVGLKGLINKTATTNVAPETGSATVLKQTKTQFYYRIAGKQLIRALHIYPLQDDAIYTIKLLSGATADLQNRTQYSGSTYKLRIGNETFTTEPISVANIRDQYWRIDVTESNQPNINAPAFEFTYYPHHVRFLSNQAGHYVIAFGSATVNTFSPTIPQGMDNGNNHIQALTLSPAQALSGEERLTPPPPPKNYKKIILWLVLALVLVVMGFMVMRLLRHMREIN